MKAPFITTIILVAGIAMGTAAQAKGERPTDLVAADLGIEESVFIECFSGVSPDKDHNPSGARQHANKAVLLPCLQAANPDITNDMLDTVMDRYRPEGPIRN